MIATDLKEVLREQVNDLIRSSCIDLGADQFVDFDAAVRDPAVPEKVQAGLVDGAHPNEAFEQRLARAVVEAVDGFPPLTL